MKKGEPAAAALISRLHPDLPFLRLNYAGHISGLPEPEAKIGTRLEVKSSVIIFYIPKKFSPRQNQTFLNQNVEKTLETSVNGRTRPFK